MQARLNPYRESPDTMQALVDLEAAVQKTGLETSLLDLIKTRASQINGCAYCIHMHTRDARARGESEARLYLLDAWRHSPLYSERERAALGWTEAVTLVSQTQVPDAVFEAAQAQFTAEELVKLTLAVAAINAWNRVAISCRSRSFRRCSTATVRARPSAPMSTTPSAPIAAPISASAPTCR